MNRKEHWEKIYQTKALNEVSWFQEKPTTSLDFIHEYQINKTAKIIDVGGGDSLFVDHLLALGYSDITVLDISESALNRAKIRLGASANQVKWIVADAANFTPPEKYDFWHDRAAFHFLTLESEVENYVKSVSANMNPDGVLVIGTFSESGPLKCSGIEIKQYNEDRLSQVLDRFFKKIKCIAIDHATPFNTIQNFIFCSFRKMHFN